MAPAATQDRDGSGYERRTLVAPASLCELADAGASFHFSRLGNVRVWLNGKVHAAETEADCRLDAGRPLTAEETEYLNAYLLHIGRRWNDVDQPRHRDDPA